MLNSGTRFEYMSLVIMLFVLLCGFSPVISDYIVFGQTSDASPLTTDVDNCGENNKKHTR